MNTIIELQKLTKVYGKSRGIQDISLAVESGTIFGFLGPNGAGKTTTISLLVDLLRPTSGSALIFGKNAQDEGIEVRKRIGFLAGDMALDGSLTGRQQLEYFGNVAKRYDKAYVNQLAERLDCDLSKKIKTLSRGNKQKIGLLSSLMHKPDLLILDEPTSGLDPLIQQQFNEILLEHKKAGKTTFISSHILSEVQQLCDHVAFVREGKLITTKPVSEILFEAPYRVTLATTDKKLIQVLHKLPEVHEKDKNQHTFDFTYVGDINKLFKIMSGYEVKDIAINRGDLESTFMEYYREES